MAPRISPFLHPGATSVADSLSIVHLRRDLQAPTILRQRDEEGDGYSEGKVVNTRFGSFPHKTLIGLPWGSQVRASKVDTGSRGRRGKGQDKKRSRNERDGADAEADSHTQNKRPKLSEDQGTSEASTPIAAKEETDPVTASTGFIHLLPPTPENWTSSLPHRTQVVYTPDYSYILHRLRARPGTSLIEAGAGSGSFTHASVRAIYNGYPQGVETEGTATKRRKVGKVWSFEFHEQRYEKLQEEIKEHALEDLVKITHRDVCRDGFLVDGKSPEANAVFLDLPAPWLALPHLTRSKPAATQFPNGKSVEGSDSLGGTPSSEKPFVSALSSTGPVHLCTFSPCIEQVQRTVSTMRQLGWVEISMVEISQKRIEVSRQRIGLEHGSLRGDLAIPASVDEALQRLIKVEGAFKAFHGSENREVEKKKPRENPHTREKRLESLVEHKSYKDGRLIHKTEPEVKTHTSYLVFAILPQEWSEEDEKRARAQWPKKIRDDKGNGRIVGMSKREAKRAEWQAKKDAESAALKTPGDDSETKMDLEQPISVPTAED